MGLVTEIWLHPRFGGSPQLIVVTKMPLPAALRRIKKLLPTFSKEHRILSVIIIAASFFALEVAIAFITHSLALLADAFHIFSDILGYMVAWLAARYVRRPARGSAQFTFGYRKAEELGGFFNGGASYRSFFCMNRAEVECSIPRCSGSLRHSSVY